MGDGEEKRTSTVHRTSHHALHDLLEYRVKEILLVSTLYDAFILQEDRGLSEAIFGEYVELGLSLPPRVNRVPTAAEALAELEARDYDLVIAMTHLIDPSPEEFGRRAKQVRPGISVILLEMDISNIEQVQVTGRRENIDKVFYWQGDTRLLLAIIKYIEDKRNVDADTELGLVGVVLVVEDSIRFYSAFLPTILSQIMVQNRSLVDEGLNEHQRMLKKRARPKILMAETFEEAVELYERYREHMLGVITDSAYHRGGELDDEAGLRFLELVKRDDIAVLLQSSETELREEAEAHGARFLHKGSATLLSDLTEFIQTDLGLGDFVFRLPDGNEVDRAENLTRFLELVEEVPIESLLHHGRANQFSTWLMARGEFELARKLRPKRVEDFVDPEDLRRELTETIRRLKRERQLAVITDFWNQDFEFEETLTRIGGGSLGGKGRGIAFFWYLLKKMISQTGCPFLEHVHIPETFVVATSEFDTFMADNELKGKLTPDLSDRQVASLFLAAELPARFQQVLKVYLDHARFPLAVRSSSLLEDSKNQCFGGIYSTYFLANNHEDDNVRLDKLCQAIKLVYASTFYRAARSYINSTAYRLEEEKMAVVIQKLVGNDFSGKFYPVISGVARSNNFYALPPLNMEDGIASVAMGHGRIVVEGGQVLSFSPRYPTSIPGFSTTHDILCNSQQGFFYLDLEDQEIDLAEGEKVTLRRAPIEKAEEDGTLARLASVYDAADDRIRDSIAHTGRRLITFAPILKHDLYPLAQIITRVLEIGEQGVGGPVEVEFAASLDEEEAFWFHLLQIRPLLYKLEHETVEVNESAEDQLLFSSQALGNCILDGIHDVIFVLQQEFDRAATVEVAAEIGAFNDELHPDPYILIGPGRWGSQDQWLGIPVEWHQISGARVIVETPMEDISVEPSQGSHFFHNITNLGIPYLTIGRKEDLVDWERLEDDPTKTGRYVAWVHLEDPLLVKVDGRSGRGVVRWPAHK